MYTERCVNRAMGHTFDISLANIHQWRNDSNFIFFLQNNNQVFTTPRKEDIYK